LPKASITSGIVTPRPGASLFARIVTSPPLQNLHSYCFNMQAPEEAIEAYRELMAKYPTEHNIAYAHFHMGLMRYAMRGPHLAEALKDFQLVASRYPSHRCAKSARGMIKLIEQKVTDEMLRE
jgi:outer membrane protein assembly factor BamD (BamD/ComL family)